MIIHCTTPQQIEDVIATYDLKLYDALPILFDVYKELQIQLKLAQLIDSHQKANKSHPTQTGRRDMK